MEITSTERDHVLVVSIRGNIDALTADKLVDEIKTRILEGHINLIVDLSQVDYMSSAGLRSIMISAKESRSRGGDFFLAGVRGDPERVLRMTGFTSIVKVYPDADTAVASLAPQAS